jgi:hypothetical protein
MKWFRFYSEFVDDPKIAMMSDSDQLLWVKALCLASDSLPRGEIRLTDEEICWKLRINPETWRHAIDKFRAKGMIEHIKGGYKITNWCKRQFESDNASQRVAKHRANKGSNKQKQPCNVTSNVSVTPPEQIQITDTESEQIHRQNKAEDLVLGSHTSNAHEEIKNEESVWGSNEGFDFWEEPEKEKPKLRPLQTPTPINQNSRTLSETPDQGSAAQPLPIFGETRRISNLEKPPSQWVPRWRTGMGPNQWHEGFVDWMTINMFSGAKRSRGDVVAYLRKREADPTGAARQDIEAKFDDYEQSWAAKTGNSADDEWIELGKLVNHVMERKNVA